MDRSILVLASNSPRRRDLLSLGGWMFHVHPTEVDESPHLDENPRTYVLRLARSKARACASAILGSGSSTSLSTSEISSHDERIVIAADTSVSADDNLLGKPADMVEAIDMLRRLRGRVHQVYTGIAALRLSDNRLVTESCTTDVPMRAYSEEEIEAYVATGDPLDKAGAYAIQDAGFHPVESLAGCYASVMGLPLCHLTRALHKLDVSPNWDIAAECQTSLDYECPVHTRILSGMKRSKRKVTE